MRPHLHWLDDTIATIDRQPFAPRRIGKVTAFDGVAVEVVGVEARIGALLTIGNRTTSSFPRRREAITGNRGPHEHQMNSHLRGDDEGGDFAEALPVLTEAIGFRGDRLLLAPLGRVDSIAPGMPVETHLGSGTTPPGSALLGRAIDALGEPLDGKPVLATTGDHPLTGRPRSASQRGRVEQRFATGIRAIDAALTLGRGQRAILAAGAGVGKSVLMQQIMTGCQADAIVVALVGERGREIADFRHRAFGGPAADKTILVAAAADLAPQLRLRGVQRATAIAETLAAEGKHVLLLVDSLTRVAHAQREIGLALGEPPTARGYPPSALALIPRLLERAGVDALTGGSITALYTVLMDGNDRDDPVVDTARAISDGHIILSRDLAEQGIFPAIDISASLSRVMDDLVAADQREAARTLRRLWSLHAANRDLLMIGAYVPGSDPLLDRAIALHPAILDFLRQPPDAYVASEDAVAVLIDLVGSAR